MDLLLQVMAAALVQQMVPKAAVAVVVGLVMAVEMVALEEVLTH